MNWINKLTLKDNTVSYCFIVYMWQTLPPLLLQTVPWGPYFPLRKDCLQHYGKDKYFWVCIIIISLWLKHLKTAIVNFFSKTTHCPFNTNWTQHCIQKKKKSMKLVIKLQRIITWFVQSLEIFFSLPFWGDCALYCGKLETQTGQTRRPAGHQRWPPPRASRRIFASCLQVLATQKPALEARADE